MAKKFPIIEIFGPTIQGEGNMCGRQTHFIRSGGCDYKCTMCDSMHAVDPALIKQNRTMMTAEQIVHDIKTLDDGNGCPWVTLSGGNPAMWDYGDVVHELQKVGFKVAVETQGTLAPEWIQYCNLVTVSPKGPGMGEETDWEVLEEFMDSVSESNVCLKVVIFNEKDFDFAKEVWAKYPRHDLYLSLGNPWLPGDIISRDDHILGLLGLYHDLAEKVYKDSVLNKATFLPQLHALIYSNDVGR